MSDFTIKTGDRLPKLRMALSADGAPIDLTTVTGVTLRLRDQRGGALLALAGTTAIITPAAGVVEYSWATGDTATPGEYFGEWVLTYAPGVTRTLPASSETGEPNFFTVTIGPTL